MHREKEYKHLAQNARDRAGDEKNAQFKAQWEILAMTYVHLADQSIKVDDLGTDHGDYDPLDRARTVWP